ncbi:MAG: biotin/lipoyl-containing protein [Clostridia bacterium]|nr:biotin/lipoyl-containing protein [Clostridia bacterium]
MRKYNVTVNGTLYEVEVEEVGGTYAAPVAAPAPVATAPAPTAAPAAPVAPKTAPGSAGANAIKAPMQGNIMKVNVKPGDAVKKGDVLLVLEAMKMENDIKAPNDGTIATVDVKSGDTVATDDVLVTMN